MMERFAPALSRLFGRAARASAPQDEKATRALADLWTTTAYIQNHHWTVRWLGFNVLQLPNDLVILQEVIHRTKPRVIVETGTFGGGTAVFYSSILALLGGEGRVISVDVRQSAHTREAVKASPFGDRITLIAGDSKSPATVEQVRQALGGETAILVALDSDHTAGHVLEELRMYADFVPVGGYLVVFDTIGRVLRSLPPEAFPPSNDPSAALETFLRERPEFEVDTSCDRLMVSFCPGGFLRRIR